MPIVYSRKRKHPPHPPSPTVPTNIPPTSPYNSPFPSPKRRKLIQLHIDAGQSDIAIRKCPVCHMLYTPGATGDADVHRAHHANYLRSQQPPKLAKGLRRISETRHGAFHVAKASDAAKVIRFVKRVDEWVARYLGDWVGFSGHWMVVLYVENGAVKGYLYGEQVGCVVDRREWKKGNFCGVARVWVMEDVRRKGIATSMVDVLRRELTYGFVFPGRCVAFSATTALGTLLANSYATKHSGRVLMYVLNNGTNTTGLKARDTLP